MGLKLNNNEYDGVVTCALGVTDLEKAISWYAEVLGFELLYKLEDQSWAELKTPVENVLLGLSVMEKVSKGGGAVLTWGVKDIDHAHGQLKAHDTKFDGDIQEIPGMVKLLTFYDPDGNAFMIAQDLTKS